MRGGRLSAAAALRIEVEVLFEPIELPVVVCPLEALLDSNNSGNSDCFLSNLVTGSQNATILVFVLSVRSMSGTLSPFGCL